MQTKISKSRFKARALEIIRHVELSGEQVIVTDHGTPRVIVRKYVGGAPTALAKLSGSVLRYDDPLEPIAVDG